MNHLERKALEIMNLCLCTTISFNISKEKSMKGFIDAFVELYKKPSSSNKVFLMIILFNMKISEVGFVVNNEFNTITN